MDITRLGRMSTALLVAALALSACATPPPATPAADAPVLSVQVDAVGMRYLPDRIEVPSGSHVIIELTNADRSDVHDLVFANGTGSERLWPGATESIDVGVVTEDLDGWCSVSGHRAQGMELLIVVTPADR